MSPVRLFLFISFVHFGALALMTAKGSVSDTPESSPSDLVLPYPMSVPELDSLFSVEPTQDQIETARARLDPEQRDRLDDILGRGPDDLNRKILASFLATETGESGGMRTILFRLMGLGIVAYYVLSLRCYFQEGWGTTLARWAAFAVLSTCVFLGTGLALLLLT